MEVWKVIPGYEGLYKVSNHGNVFSIRNNKLLKPTIDHDGYIFVGLCKEGKAKQIKTARLVLKAFRPCEGFDNLSINHKDGDKANNRLSNLEMCTMKENSVHASKVLHRGHSDVGRNKAVLMIDKETGRIVKRFASGSEAVKKMKLCGQLISKCCNNIIKTYKGYVWQFADAA